MNKKILEKWLDYRIKLWKDSNKHVGLKWGKGSNNWQSEFTACGVSDSKEIHIFISQFAQKKRIDIFNEVADILGVATYDDDGRGIMWFMYKGFKVFAFVTYDDDEIKCRKMLKLEV